MKNQWISDEFWVSPYNYEPEVTDRKTMPKTIIVHDATLRDGEQTPGVVFSIEDKIAIAKALDEIGVDRIEAGSPFVAKQEEEAIRAIVELGLKADIYCLSRAMTSDIDLAVSCGLQGIVMETPVGIPRLKYQYANWSEEKAIDLTVKGLTYAKEKGLKVTFFMMDTSRSDKGFLERLLSRLMKDAVPDAITVVDTSGCLIPAASYNVVKFVKEITGLPVEIHAHNDMGLGLANTLAAIEAGAEVAHVCVNGLGERAGNVALDELAVSLHCLYGAKTGIDRKKLTELSKLVEKLSKIPVNYNKPVIGDGVYRRESGMGIELIQTMPLAIFSLVPKAVGQKPDIVLGKKSGIASVQVTAERLGIDGLTEKEMRDILAEIKGLGIAKKGLVLDDEFIEITKKVRMNK